MDFLQEELYKDLNLINYPPVDWIKKDSVLHVAIIGGGMAGLCTAFALKRQGISHIKIFDENPAGEEGPWVTYARMRTLRSTKEMMGPALDMPKLTFQAWYKAQWGEDAWNALYKIPNRLWMNYLNWYKTVLGISVQNRTKIQKIIPENNFLKLIWKDGEVLAHKVVLCTGRGGFGGNKVPSWSAQIPKTHWAHTCEHIDLAQLHGKAVAVIGIGASAFDAAAASLEAGAKSATLLMRRAEINNINKFAHLIYPGFYEGFYFLPTDQKCRFLKQALDKGAVPPVESIQRALAFTHFSIKSLEEIPPHGYDYYIFATGFDVNGKKQEELLYFIDSIALWKDYLSSEQQASYPFAVNYPFLGPHFQFIERQPSSFLKHIYCFNHAALMSHGIIASDIPGISVGAQRLARGITIDFFVENQENYSQNLMDYQVEEFPKAIDALENPDSL